MTQNTKKVCFSPSGSLALSQSRKSLIHQQTGYFSYFIYFFVIQEQTLPFGSLLFILNNILNVIDIEWQITEIVSSKTQGFLNLFGTYRLHRVTFTKNQLWLSRAFLWFCVTVLPEQLGRASLPVAILVLPQCSDEAQTQRWTSAPCAVKLKMHFPRQFRVFFPPSVKNSFYFKGCVMCPQHHCPGHTSVPLECPD